MMIPSENNTAMSSPFLVSLSPLFAFPSFLLVLWFVCRKSKNINNNNNNQNNLNYQSVSTRIVRVVLALLASCLLLIVSSLCFSSSSLPLISFVEAILFPYNQNCGETTTNVDSTLFSRMDQNCFPTTYYNPYSFVSTSTLGGSSWRSWARLYLTPLASTPSNTITVSLDTPQFFSSSASPKCEGIHIDINTTTITTVNININDASFSTASAPNGNDFCDFDIIVHSRVPIKLTILVQDSQLAGKIDVRAPLKVDSSIRVLNSRIKGLYVASNYAPITLDNADIWRDGVTVVSTHFSATSIWGSSKPSSLISPSSTFSLPTSSPLFPKAEPEWNAGSGAPFASIPQFTYSGNPASYANLAEKRISLSCKNSQINVDTTKIDNTIKKDVLTVIGNTSTILLETCTVGTGGVSDGTKLKRIHIQSETASLQQDTNSLVVLPSESLFNYVGSMTLNAWEYQTGFNFVAFGSSIIRDSAYVLLNGITETSSSASSNNDALEIKEGNRFAFDKVTVSGTLSHLQIGLTRDEVLGGVFGSSTDLSRTSFIANVSFATGFQLASAANKIVMASRHLDQYQNIDMLMQQTTSAGSTADDIKITGGISYSSITRPGAEISSLTSAAAIHNFYIQSVVFSSTLSALDLSETQDPKLQIALNASSTASTFSSAGVITPLIVSFADATNPLQHLDSFILTASDFLANSILFRCHSTQCKNVIATKMFFVISNSNWQLDDQLTHQFPPPVQQDCVFSLRGATSSISSATTTSSSPHVTFTLVSADASNVFSQNSRYFFEVVEGAQVQSSVSTVEFQTDAITTTTSSTVDLTVFVLPNAANTEEPISSASKFRLSSVLKRATRAMKQDIFTATVHLGQPLLVSSSLFTTTSSSFQQSLLASCGFFFNGFTFKGKSGVVVSEISSALPQLPSPNFFSDEISIPFIWFRQSILERDACTAAASSPPFAQSLVVDERSAHSENFGPIRVMFDQADVTSSVLTCTSVASPTNTSSLYLNYPSASSTATLSSNAQTNKMIHLLSNSGSAFKGTFPILFAWSDASTVTTSIHSLIPANVSIVDTAILFTNIPLTQPSATSSYSVIENLPANSSIIFLSTPTTAASHSISLSTSSAGTTTSQGSLSLVSSAASVPNYFLITNSYNVTIDTRLSGGAAQLLQVETLLVSSFWSSPSPNTLLIQEGAIVRLLSGGTTGKSFLVHVAGETLEGTASSSNFNSSLLTASNLIKIQSTNTNVQLNSETLVKLVNFVAASVSAVSAISLELTSSAYVSIASTNSNTDCAFPVSAAADLQSCGAFLGQSVLSVRISAAAQLFISSNSAAALFYPLTSSQQSAYFDSISANPVGIKTDFTITGANTFVQLKGTLGRTHAARLFSAVDASNTQSFNQHYFLLETSARLDVFALSGLAEVSASDEQQATSGAIFFFTSPSTFSAAASSQVTPSSLTVTTTGNAQMNVFLNGTETSLNHTGLVAATPNNRHSLNLIVTETSAVTFKNQIDLFSSTSSSETTTSSLVSVLDFATSSFHSLSELRYTISKTSSVLFNVSMRSSSSSNSLLKVSMVSGREIEQVIGSLFETATIQVIAQSSSSLKEVSVIILSKVTNIPLLLSRDTVNVDVLIMNYSSTHSTTFNKKIFSVISIDGKSELSNNFISLNSETRNTDWKVTLDDSNNILETQDQQLENIVTVVGVYVTGLELGDTHLQTVCASSSGKTTSFIIEDMTLDIVRSSSSSTLSFPSSRNFYQGIAILDGDGSSSSAQPVPQTRTWSSVSSLSGNCAITFQFSRVVLNLNTENGPNSKMNQVASFAIAARGNDTLPLREAVILDCTLESASLALSPNRNSTIIPFVASLGGGIVWKAEMNWTDTNFSKSLDFDNFNDSSPVYFDDEAPSPPATVLREYFGFVAMDGNHFYRNLDSSISYPYTNDPVRLLPKNFFSSAPAQKGIDYYYLACNSFNSSVLWINDTVNFAEAGKSFHLEYDNARCAVPTTTSTTTTSTTTTTTTSTTTNTSTTTSSSTTTETSTTSTTTDTPTTTTTTSSTTTPTTSSTTTTTDVPSNGTSNDTTTSTSSSTTTSLSPTSGGSNQTNPPTTTSTTTTSPPTTGSFSSTTSTTTTTVLPTTTSFVNITTNPPPRVKDPEVESAQDTAKAATVASAAVGAGFASVVPSPSTAVLASRLGLIDRISGGCTPRLNQTLQFYESPFDWKIKFTDSVAAEDVQYHVGGLMTNSLIIIGVSALSWCVAYAFFQWKMSRRKSKYKDPQVEAAKTDLVWQESLALSRFPGCHLFFILFTLQPFIGSSFTIILFGDTPSTIFALMVLISMITLICLIITQVASIQSRFMATYRTKVQIEAEEKALMEISKSSSTDEMPKNLHDFSMSIGLRTPTAAGGAGKSVAADSDLMSISLLMKSNTLQNAGSGGASGSRRLGDTSNDKDDDDDEEGIIEKLGGLFDDYILGCQGEWFDIPRCLVDDPDVEDVQLEASRLPIVELRRLQESGRSYYKLKKARMAEQAMQKKNDEENQDSSTVTKKNQNKKQTPLFTNRNLLKLPQKTYFVTRYGHYFDCYRGSTPKTIGRHWFIAADLSAASILGVADGLITSFGCSAIGWILISIFGMYVVSLVVLRPMVTRFESIFVTIVGLLQLCAAVVAVLTSEDADAADPNSAGQLAVARITSAALMVGTIQVLLIAITDLVKYFAANFKGCCGASKRQKRMDNILKQMEEETKKEEEEDAEGGGGALDETARNENELNRSNPLEEEMTPFIVSSDESKSKNSNKNVESLVLPTNINEENNNDYEDEEEGASPLLATKDLASFSVSNKRFGPKFNTTGRGGANRNSSPEAPEFGTISNSMGMMTPEASYSNYPSMMQSISEHPTVGAGSAITASPSFNQNASATSIGGGASIRDAPSVSTTTSTPPGSSSNTKLDVLGELIVAEKEAESRRASRQNSANASRAHSPSASMTNNPFLVGGIKSGLPSRKTSTVAPGSSSTSSSDGVLKNNNNKYDAKTSDGMPLYKNRELTSLTNENHDETKPYLPPTSPTTTTTPPLPPGSKNASTTSTSLQPPSFTQRMENNNNNDNNNDQYRDEITKHLTAAKLVLPEESVSAKKQDDSDAFVSPLFAMYKANNNNNNDPHSLSSTSDNNNNKHKQQQPTKEDSGSLNPNPLERKGSSGLLLLSPVANRLTTINNNNNSCDSNSNNKKDLALFSPPSLLLSPRTPGLDGKTPDHQINNDSIILSPLQKDEMFAKKKGPSAINRRKSSAFSLNNSNSSRRKSDRFGIMNNSTTSTLARSMNVGNASGTTAPNSDFDSDSDEDVL